MPLMYILQEMKEQWQYKELSLCCLIALPELLLCSRFGPLKKRFEEYQRRVVPVFFHGAGCWSWNHDLRMKVHRWDGKHLATMMPLKKSHKEEAEDNDAYESGGHAEFQWPEQCMRRCDSSLVQRV